jgi:hypothetical protein
MPRLSTVHSAQPNTSIAAPSLSSSSFLCALLKRRFFSLLCSCLRAAISSSTLRRSAPMRFTTLAGLEFHRQRLLAYVTFPATTAPLVGREGMSVHDHFPPSNDCHRSGSPCGPEQFSSVVHKRSQDMATVPVGRFTPAAKRNRPSNDVSQVIVINATALRATIPPLPASVREGEGIAF